MKRILFVDDESNVLDGLRDLLRKQRRHWDMVFALGADAALAELQTAPFDVIVSDMRMPGMDGAALLARVKRDHPAVARIVLSGHAEREAVVRALPVAHQFLSKPCDAELLRVVIDRACNLQGLLTDPLIRDVVGKVDKLPSVPRTYWELTKAVERADTSLADVSRIVEKDPAMVAKMLQLVNSAYFGLAKRITSIDQAVTYLGIEMLKALALTAQVFAAMESAPVDGFSMERLQDYSVLTARVARRILPDAQRAAEAFTAGIVHDVGKIILALGLPERFMSAAREVRKSGRPLHLVEQEAFGVSHAEVGAYLLGVWGVPFSIVEAVAYHHRPGLVTEGARDVLAAVHIADALVDTACTGETDPPPDEKVDLAFVESVGMAADLARWRAIADEEANTAAQAQRGAA